MCDLFSAFISHELNWAIKCYYYVLVCVSWLPCLQYQTAYFKIYCVSCQLWGQILETKQLWYERIKMPDSSKQWTKETLSINSHSPFRSATYSQVVYIFFTLPVNEPFLKLFSEQIFTQFSNWSKRSHERLKRKPRFSLKAIVNLRKSSQAEDGVLSLLIIIILWQSIRTSAIGWTPLRDLMMTRIKTLPIIPNAHQIKPNSLHFLKPFGPLSLYPRTCCHHGWSILLPLIQNSNVLFTLLTA